MFFPRLRRRAKWVFALLAVAFALAFVVAGVGSGFGSGLGDYLADIFNRQPGAGSSDAEEARKAAYAAPKDDEKAESYLEAISLDESLSVEQKIVEMERYMKLRPEDTEALQQLAGYHQQQAAEAERRAQAAQVAASRAFFANEITNPGGELTQAIGTDPITARIREEASTTYSTAVALAQGAYGREAEVWERLTKLEPEEPLFFFDLGRSSQQAGNTEQAITAFERFLKLAPDAPETQQVKQIVQQLKQQQAAQPPVTP